jgi:methyltransferase
VTLAECILLLVTLQRVGELVVSHRNTAALRACGGIEVASRHYPLIVATHAAWLLALWVLGHDQSVHLFALGVYLLLQGLRFWVLYTLGPRWTTRIIVLSGQPLVAAGPYRFLSHPNYAVVCGEIAVLPLVFGLTIVAAVFTILNAAVLAIRIRAENRALVASGGTRESGAS